MKKFKVIISLMLIIVSVLSFTACWSYEQKAESSQPTTTEFESATTPTATTSTNPTKTTAKPYSDYFGEVRTFDYDEIKNKEIDLSFTIVKGEEINSDENDAEKYGFTVGKLNDEALYRLIFSAYESNGAEFEEPDDFDTIPGTYELFYEPKKGDKIGMVKREDDGVYFVLNSKELIQLNYDGEFVVTCCKIEQGEIVDFLVHDQIIYAVADGKILRIFKDAAKVRTNVIYDDINMEYFNKLLYPVSNFEVVWEEENPEFWNLDILKDIDRNSELTEEDFDIIAQAYQYADDSITKYYDAKTKTEKSIDSGKFSYGWWLSEHSKSATDYIDYIDVAEMLDFIKPNGISVVPGGVSYDGLGLLLYYKDYELCMRTLGEIYVMFDIKPNFKDGNLASVTYTSEIYDLDEFETITDGDVPLVITTAKSKEWRKDQTMYYLAFWAKDNCQPVYCMKIEKNPYIVGHDSFIELAKSIKFYDGAFDEIPSKHFGS